MSTNLYIHPGKMTHVKKTSEKTDEEISKEWETLEHQVSDFANSSINALGKVWKLFRNGSF